MPIPVKCPGCQSRLNAPDAAAGKRVKCPKCQTSMSVPAAAGGSGAAPPPAPRPAPPPPPPPGEPDTGSPFNFTDPAPIPKAGDQAPPAVRPAAAAPPPSPAAGGGSPFDFDAAAAAGAGKPPRNAKPAPAGKKPARPAEDDDEDDEEAPPRRGGRRPPPRGAAGKKSGSPLVLILVGVGLLFLTCCVAGPIGAYFYLSTKVKEGVNKIQQDLDKAARNTGREPQLGTAGDRAPVPPGWQQYTAPDNSFKAYFPAEPKQKTETVTLPGPRKRSVPLRSYEAETPDGSMMTFAGVGRFPASVPAAERTKLVDEINKDLFAVADEPPEPKDVTWLGERAKEYVVRLPGKGAQIVVRQVLIDDVVYVGLIGSKEGAPAPDLVKGFFDNFETTAR